MHHFFLAIEHFFRVFSTAVPLEVFVFVGSFLEEIISPIPAALIMGTAGSLALLHHESLWYLVWLALLGNVGKLLGSWFYYFVGDRLEDIFSAKAQKFFGINHEEIQNFGKRFTGHHWKDGGTLFGLRLLPFFPTLPVSVAAGIIKMDIRVFLGASYMGNLLIYSVYLYIGYAGLARLHLLWRHLEPVKFTVDTLVTLAILSLLFFLYTNRGAGKKLWSKLEAQVWQMFSSKK